MADQWASTTDHSPLAPDSPADTGGWASTTDHSPIASMQVSQSHARIPYEFKPTTDSPWNAMIHPTEGWIGQGIRQIGAGFKHFTEPGLPAKYMGASDVIRGTGKALTPVAIGATLPAAWSAPAATAGAVGLGTVGAIAGGIAGNYGAQALDASPEAQQLSGDVGGLVGGIGGGYLGSKLPSLFKVDPRIAISRSLRPVPSNPDFTENIPDTLSTIKALNPGFKPGLEDGKLNVVPAANRAIGAYQDALEPWLQRMEGTKVSGAPIVQATQDAVSQMLPSEEASAGQALVDRARSDYSDLSPRALRDRLALLNQRMASFYNQAPNRQSAALADIPEAVLKAQRDAVADTLYRHLDPENGGAGPRLIQSKTGDLIDLRDAALRRQNAIVAEQPLTPFGKVVDPVKRVIRSVLPGKATGAGIAYAEGSEGRSLPLLQRAFNAVDETQGANEFGTIPKPGPRLLNAPADTSGALPRSVADAMAIGYQPQTPLLLAAPNAGASPLNVQGTRGPGSIGPGGTVSRLSSETPIPMPGVRGGRMADLVSPPTPSLTMQDAANYAVRKGISLMQAARELGIVVNVHGYARGGIIGRLPPRIQVPHYDRGGIVNAAALAKGQQSSIDVIRGSSDVPLSPEGERQAADLAQAFAGKVTKIYTSDLKRASDTASAIASTNPQAGPPELTDGLRPWHLGEFEGQPTRDVLDKINEYATKKPDEPVPGRGEMSTADGESFNSFKNRGVGKFKDLVAEYQAGLQSGQEPVIVALTHYRGVRLLKSWHDKGLPVDGSVEAKDMVKHVPGDDTGTIHQLRQDDSGKLALNSIPLTSAKLKQPQLEHGIYVTRHGRTALNGA